MALSACNNGTVNPQPNAMEKLNSFKEKPKFEVDEKLGYMGLGSPELYSVMNGKMNAAADDFAKVASLQSATEKAYQDAISIGLKRFEEVYLELDTEDRERVCHYYEELMDIVGLKSSGGLLNKFMYGFDVE